MLLLITALLYSIVGYVRGRGYIPVGEHVIAPLAWAAITAVLAYHLNYSTSYIVAIFLVTFVGLVIWLVGLWKGWGGWGLYFASWTWLWDPNQHEVPPIDWIGLKLVPFQTATAHWTNGLRGTICMSLRGLYILPLFYWLSLPGIGIIVGLSQGLVYGAMHWLAPTGAGTKYAEPVFAFITGATVAYKISIGF